MTYTWGTTNRMYAIANRSGDPAQIAWVRHCRSKLTARRNRVCAERRERNRRVCASLRRW